MQVLKYDLFHSFQETLVVIFDRELGTSLPDA